MTNEPTSSNFLKVYQTVVDTKIELLEKKSSLDILEAKLKEILVQINY